MKTVLMLFIAMSFNLYAMINTSKIFNDSDTGLMWQDNEDSVNEKRDWGSAKEYCEDFSIEGYDDWHLPTVEQLLTITDKEFYDPSVKQEIEYISSEHYWSSSEFLPDEIFAWSVNFKFGSSSSPRDKAAESNVRCVRVGQYNTLPFDSLIAKVAKEENSESVKGISSLNIIKSDDETQDEFSQKLKNISAVKRTLEMTWGKPMLNNVKYDKVNHYFEADLSFEAKKNFFKKITIDVESRYSLYFLRDLQSVKSEAIFDFDGDSVKLKDVKISYDNRSYLVNFIDVAEEDFIVSLNVSNKFDEEGLNNFYELDNLLKKSLKIAKNSKKWLFVVGIEYYENIDNVNYAKRSAELFAKTAQRRLGIFEQQSYVLTNSDATKLKIERNFNKMLQKIKKGDIIYFYFAGHGAVVPSLGNEAFLLASDSVIESLADEKFLSLRNIYSKLSYSRASKIITFLDSDFNEIGSKTQSDENSLASVRFNQGKMVVLNASVGMKTAKPYVQKAHRLFGYHLIKEIIDGTKHIKGFFKSVEDQMLDTQAVIDDKQTLQEPTIHGNLRLTL